MNILKVAQGEFQLARYPKRKKELLQAWDAADEYLLNYLSESQITNEKLNILIVNDSFAALSTVLAEHNITFWSDSWLSYKSIEQNFQNNQLSVENIQFKKSTEEPEGEFDLVIIKIPKSLAFLEEQLIRINPNLTSATKVVSAGMVKNIHTSTLNLFEKYIGETKTSLAKKKARLIFSQVDVDTVAVNSPYPKSYILEGTDHEITNHANVFSREKLDIGTRLFLEYLPQAEKYKNIIDLACGNGVVGLVAASKNPTAKLQFVDESYMAVESARENFIQAFPSRDAVFQEMDCLSNIDENSSDLILNNPPFHQNNAIGDEVAWQMFTQSYAVLKRDGELWVVGNRHLAYHIKLKKIFSNCITVASNKKFVVLMSVKK